MSNDLSTTRHLHAHEAQRIRWRNGLGWTREIHVEPAVGADDWIWRLSIAEIEQPAAFSRFEGVERELMLRSGDGLTLRFDDGQVSELLPPHARLRFGGERMLSGEPAGPGVTALNLMWRPSSITVTTWHRPLVGAMVVFVDPGDCWLVHVLAGQARLATDTSTPAEAGDTLLLRAPKGRGRHALEGGGELLLARISAAEPGPESGTPASPEARRASS